MKHLCILFFIAFFLATTFSCKKHDEAEGNVVNVTLRTNERYPYNLGSFGIEEGASISRQASHYQESKVERLQSDLASVYYYYQPIPGYIGDDEVELKAERGSNGASQNDKISYVTIRFTIVK